MEFCTLGRTGMKVSKLCVGTWNFGTYTDEKEAFGIMDEALDAGINFIDTANAYPAVGHRGKSEEIIGRWFALGNGRRERTVLATKVFSYTENEYDGPNEGHGLSTYKIRRHLEASLRRLNTEHIELYQMHHVWREATWEELWDVFESIFLQGKTDYIGSCNFAGLHLMQAQYAAKERHFLGLASEQHQYNLLCRLPELEVIPAAQYLGIGFLPYSPLAGGKLAGRAMMSGDGKSRRQDIKGTPEQVEKFRKQTEEFANLCNEIGESEANVALAWLLSNPAVTSVVTGPRTVGQLKGMLRAVEIKLDGAALARLDEVFPGPGGPAPEAYAW